MTFRLHRQVPELKESCHHDKNPSIPLLWESWLQSFPSTGAMAVTLEILAVLYTLCCHGKGVTPERI